MKKAKSIDFAFFMFFILHFGRLNELIDSLITVLFISFAFLYFKLLIIKKII